MSSLNQTLKRLALTAALFFIAVPQFAAAIYSEQIKCGDILCGIMDITAYEEHKNDTLAGVLIDGTFTAVRPSTYHYMQSVLTTTTRKWTDGTDLTVPYVDTPPGGYEGDPFDFKAYYDEGEFPAFHDRPSRLLTRADAGKVTFTWETWVVCVIEEKFGANEKQAKDDSYKLALLPKGFQWGFSIEKTGKGMTKDDYTVKKLDFAWLAAPSAPFLKSWDTVYGKGGTADRYNITRGECKDCTFGAAIPEPSTAWQSVSGGLVLLALRRRRRRQPAA